VVKHIEVVEQYRYLGLILTEFLDYNLMSKQVALAAQRSLGMLITKCKEHGGLPYKMFTKLYKGLVQPILDYGAPVWGFKEYSWIKAVQNRASRFFLGVSKYTPVVGIQGEMGWSFPEQTQWLTVIRQWCRFTNMPDTRLNKRLFLWADKQNRSLKTPLTYIKAYLPSIGAHNICDTKAKHNFYDIRSNIKRLLWNFYIQLWSTAVNRHGAIRGEGRNKLRTYQLFKFQYATEKYVKIIHSARKRAALAKFRLGVAPLRIETGRYVGENVEDRLCTLCDLQEVESEEHVITRCPIYTDIRQLLYQEASRLCDNFHANCDTDKLSFILSFTP